MGCPKTDRISAYLDKELGLTEKTELESHVHGCGICSHALEEMQSLRVAFTTTERHQAPYGFANRVMARTAKQKSSPLRGEGRVRGWLVPFSVRFAEAAILLVVITVGVLAGRVMTNNSPATQTTNIASSFSLDMFDANPPGSLGNAYLAMTEVRNEK